MLAVLLPLLFMAPSDTTIWLAPGVGLELVWIAPGTFVMGDAAVPGATPHPVTITRGFWMGRYEVTWAQWQAVMGTEPGAGTPQQPARGLSWYEAVGFAEQVAARTGLAVRLPTEAEWEYAARAGTTTPWSFGADVRDLQRHAWTREEARGVVQPVGQRAPNPWGLYDMHGNVWEWVQDWHAPAYPSASPAIDPQGPATGTEKVRRGGSAVYLAAQARSAYRYQQPPARGNSNLGFRIVALPGG